MSSHELTEWIALGQVEAEERGDRESPPPDDIATDDAEAEPEVPLTAEEEADERALDRLIEELQKTTPRTL